MYSDTEVDTWRACLWTEVRNDNNTNIWSSADVSTISSDSINEIFLLWMKRRLFQRKPMDTMTYILNSK